MDLPLLHSKSRVTSTYIPPHPTQLHPRFNRNHPNPNPNSNFPAKKNVIILSVSIFSFLFLLSAALRLRPRSPDPNSHPNHYGVVIYASQDQFQVHVFTSLDPRSESLKKVVPGLSLLGGDLEGIGGMAVELVEFTKGRVPRSKWEKTKVQMVSDVELERRVELGIVGAFLDSCRRALTSSGFLLKDEWVTTLGDKQEAVYDWIAANYALGNFGKEPQRTNTIVKLGGTSMQVTVSSLDPDVVPLSWVVKLAGVTYNLYTESVPYLGQDAMRKSLEQMYNSKNLQTFTSSEEDIARNPCLPKGYKFTINATNEKVVAGDFSLCTSNLRALLKKKQDKNCMQPPCEIISSYSIKLRGKPVPLNNFFFISEFFGFVPKASLSELEAAGHHYCEDDWHKLKSQYNDIDDLDLIKYCFSSAYVVALLHDNFGVSMIDKRIGFANPGGNVPSSWIYGAFILQILQEPVEMERVNTEEIVGNGAVAYLSLLTVLLIAVLGGIFLLKCQKPQLKTVYDLQKGHYIVTPLPR